jgi:hypothetical protein
LVAVAALDTFDENFEEVVVTSVLDTDFTLRVPVTVEEVDLGPLEDVLVDFWLETDDDVVDLKLLDNVLVDFWLDIEDDVVDFRPLEVVLADF